MPARVRTYIRLHASVSMHVCFIFTGQHKSGVIVDAQTSHGLNLVLHKCQSSMITYRDTYKTD